MRKLFIASTVVFWFAVAGFWTSSLWFTEPTVDGIQETTTNAHYTPAELAAHNREDDCWMVINGLVYDFTTYLPQHPAPPEMMLVWCGNEATQAFRTKTKGRPHSPFAVQLLTQYRIGKLHEQ